ASRAAVAGSRWDETIAPTLRNLRSAPPTAVTDAAEARDYRASARERHRSWYGLKRHVKRILSLRVPHAVLRQVVRLFPGLARNGRLPAPAALHEVEGTVRDVTFVMLRPDRCVVAKELYWGHGQRPRTEDAFALELF